MERKDRLILIYKHTLSSKLNQKESAPAKVTDSPIPQTTHKSIEDSSIIAVFISVKYNNIGR